MNNLNFTFNFARKFGKRKLAMDIIEYLVNHDGEYRGSYYTLADKLRGNKNEASNVRSACLWLEKQSILCVQSTKGNDNYNTVIIMGENWKEMV